MKMRWEMSSSQAYTKPGALVGLRMWKVLLQLKKEKKEKVSLKTKCSDRVEAETLAEPLNTVSSPEGCERLEVDGLQDVFGGVELQQQHDENAVVWQLLKFCLTDVVVLDQHPNYDTQHLEGRRREQSASNRAAG